MLLAIAANLRHLRTPGTCRTRPRAEQCDMSHRDHSTVAGSGSLWLASARREQWIKYLCDNGLTDNPGPFGNDGRS
ncbi:hypothetical protein [Burkholderia ubonensis]|uniref:hypothetical protein n=1 Tax=Burkholderia ubonensis TaxID=101571 RepID=UPI0011776264|nr:hypothetical protein [Burkholderia ubonensis]